MKTITKKQILEYDDAIKGQFKLLSPKVLTEAELRARFNVFGKLVLWEQKGCNLTCYFSDKAFADLQEEQVHEFYYLVSLKWTKIADGYISLWRHGNKGYCFAKEYAGQYTEIEEGYHNTENTFPISNVIVDKLWESVLWDMKPQLMIQNNEENLKALGLKYKKGDLVRIRAKEVENG